MGIEMNDTKVFVFFMKRFDHRQCHKVFATDHHRLFVILDDLFGRMVDDIERFVYIAHW